MLLGAVGLPKYDGQSGDRRPEKGLLDLRKALGVHANLRPVRAVAAPAGSSPLKEEVIRGTDLVVRKLLGDMYFGEPRGFSPDESSAFNTMVYSVPEVERVAEARYAKGPAERRHNVRIAISLFWS